MTDTLKLKGAIVASGLSRRQVAEKIGISCYSLHKKIHNITEFKASEIQALCEVVGIYNKDEIFFAPNVEFNSTKIPDRPLPNALRRQD